jgi:hypothetical protein
VSAEKILIHTRLLVAAPVFAVADDVSVRAILMATSL